MKLHQEDFTLIVTKTQRPDGQGHNAKVVVPASFPLLAEGRAAEEEKKKEKKNTKKKNLP